MVVTRIQALEECLSIAFDFLVYFDKRYKYKFISESISPQLIPNERKERTETSLVAFYPSHSPASSINGLWEAPPLHRNGTRFLQKDQDWLGLIFFFLEGCCFIAILIATGRADDRARLRMRALPPRWRRGIGFFTWTRRTARLVHP